MIPFTQFKLPDGHQVEVSIERPQPVEQAAKALIEAGCRFEIEVLMTGEINMEVQNGDRLLAGELCANGPTVPEAVDRMVTNAFKIQFPG